MMKQIGINEGLGKVLANLVEIDDGPYLLLVFNDQTYAVVGMHHEGDHSIDLSFDDPEFNPTNCFDYEGLIEAGIFTKEEIEALVAKKDEELRAWKDEHERRTYERLKAKYEAPEDASALRKNLRDKLPEYSGDPVRDRFREVLEELIEQVRFEK